MKFWEIVWQHIYKSWKDASENQLSHQWLWDDLAYKIEWDDTLFYNWHGKYEWYLYNNEVEDYIAESDSIIHPEERAFMLSTINLRLD